MELVPSVAVIIFLLQMFFCSRRVVLGCEKEKSLLLDELKEKLTRLENKQEHLYKEKINLQTEAGNIFTLYEITKEITHTLHEKQAFQTFQKTLAQHVKFTECSFLKPDDENIPALKKNKDYFVFSLNVKNRKVGFLVVKDMSEAEKEKTAILAAQFSLALRRVELYEAIEQVAITDSLTEVHTRRYLIDRLQEEIVRSKSQKLNLAILMIDVDHFKKFNDTYGHLSGDKILREIGRIIKENLREIDIAGRYGGEEFCVVLPDTNLEGAQFAAQRIRQATEMAIIRAYDNSLKATVSVGIAQFPKDGSKFSELIDKADWALYRAKKQGRNRVCSFGVYNEKD